MKKIIFIVFISLFIFLLVGCEKTPTLEMNDADKSITLEVGEEKLINVKASDGSLLIWEPSNDVVTVTDGKIIAVKEGTCEVVVAIKDHNDVKVTISVTVNPKPITYTLKFKDSDKNLTLTENKTKSVTPNVTEGCNVLWSSSDESIATITNGQIKALKEGTCTITAKIEGHEDVFDTINLVVEKEDIPVTYSVVVPGGSKEITLQIGEYDTVEPIYTEGETLVWSSSDNNIAIVENGTITGVGEGTCVITVSLLNHEEAKDTINVTIEKVFATSIDLKHEKDALNIKETDNLEYVIYPENASQEVKWIVEPSDAATISETGVLTALKAGIVTIKVATTDGTNLTSEYRIRIYEDATDITVTGSDTMGVKSSQKLTATIANEFCKSELIWSSSDEAVATVDQSGNVNALSSGEVIITITANDSTRTTKQFKITVRDIIVYIGNKEYPTLTEALSNAAVGDIIMLSKGQYTGDFVVDKDDITIVGPNANINPLYGERKEEAILLGSITIKEGVKNFILDGIAITGTGTIKCEKKAKNIQLRNNFIYDTNEGHANWSETRNDSTEAIFNFNNTKNGEDIDGIKISNNLFKNIKETGIYIARSRNITVSENKFDGFTHDAIRGDGGYNNGEWTFTNNTFHNDVQSGYNGIYLQSVSGDSLLQKITVSNNVFENIGVNASNVLYSGAFSVRTDQECGLEFKFLYNTVKNCVNGVHLRNNGSKASNWVGVCNYNQFIGIPEGVYHRNFRPGSGDSQSSNPILMNFDYNYFEDNQGNPIADLSTINDKVKEVKSFENTFTTRESYEKAVKELLGLDYDFVVDSKFNDLADGTKVDLLGFSWVVGTNAFAKISDAIVKASENNKIYINNGTYTEDLFIDKPLTIVGFSQNGDIGSITSKVVGKVVFKDNISDVTILYITFDSTSFAGINAKNIFISDCILNNVKASSTTINDVVYGNDGGIGFAGEVDNFVFENNYVGFISNRGIRFEAKATNIYINGNFFLESNTLYDTVRFMAIADQQVQFLNNIFSSNLQTGIQIAKVGNDLHLLIEDNLFADIKQAAIDVRVPEPGTSNVEYKIIYNTFENKVPYGWGCIRLRSVNWTSENHGVAYVNYNAFKTELTSGYYVENAQGDLTGWVDFDKNYTKLGLPASDSKWADGLAYTEKDWYSSYNDYQVVYFQYKGVSSYPIEYVLDGGKVDGKNYYDLGDSYVLPIPTKKGFTFLGWSTVAGSNEYITEITPSTFGAITLFANWKEIVMEGYEVTYNFEGGVSQELYLAKGTPFYQLTLNNYNGSDGAFWGGGYANYIYITDRANDPTATFSDRIYIGKDSETGLYVIKSILRSGGSSWAEGSEYVITISSSYIGNLEHGRIGDLSIGMVCVINGDVTEIASANPTNIYFYNAEPTEKQLKVVITAMDLIIEPSRLGYTFKGWFDENNVQYTQITQFTKNTTLTARWEALQAATDITVENMVSELVVGESYKINATVVPADAYFKDIFYSSSDSDIISIDKNGNMTAINTGSCTITIKDYFGKVVKEYTVASNPVESIGLEFNGDFDGVLAVSEEIGVRAVVYTKNFGKVPTIESLNSDVVTLTDGVLKGIKEGVAIIKVTCGEAVLTFEVIVRNEKTDLIDKLVDLIASNNFATVVVGNASIYNDGKNREYKSTYGSVNNYLFAPLDIVRTYEAQAEANGNCHKNRREGIDTIEFVTVHDTATLTGTVDSIASNMSSGETSIHYTTGNGKVMSVVPEKYIAYHAGDGTGTAFKWNSTGVTSNGEKPVFDIVKDGSKYFFTVNGQKSTIEAPISNGTKTIENPSKENLPHLGPVWTVIDGVYHIGPSWVDFSQTSKGTIGSKGGNNNSIGIEMCVNYTTDQYDNWQRTAKLVADILIRNNLDLSRVVQHNTWTGKNCPQVLIAGNYWDEFMKMVEVEYLVRKLYGEAEITMKSLDPTIINDTGHVINAPLITTIVSYEVTVKLGGETRTIKLSSIVPGTTTWHKLNGSYKSSVIWNQGNFAK